MPHSESAVLYIIGGAILLLLIWVWATYNRLVQRRNLVPESWSNIDTELRRRYDLIPNLVSVVKGYAEHERGVMEAVTETRVKAMQVEGGAEARAREENELVKSLRSLLVVAEAYPTLKADEQFLNFQRELVNTEDRIQAARRFYNANVRDLNTSVQTFPSNIIAGLFGFVPAQYFQIEEVFASMLSSVNFPADVK